MGIDGDWQYTEVLVWARDPYSPRAYLTLIDPFDFDPKKHERFSFYDYLLPRR